MKKLKPAFMHSSSFLLIKGKNIGKLLLVLPHPLRKEKQTLLQFVLPYLAWTLENGMNLVSLDDERRRLEKGTVYS